MTPSMTPLTDGRILSPLVSDAAINARRAKEQP